MKAKKTALAITIFVFAITLIACMNNDNSSAKPDEESVRTTITEDEWNKTLQMNNFTMNLEYPNTRIVTMVSENAIAEESNSDFYCYYVKENGNFYLVENVDDTWCKYSDIKGDASLSSFSNQFICNAKFEELVYDEKEKAYVEYLMVDGLETYCIYSFEDGVLTEVKHSSESWDFTAHYTITNIGKTVVNVPKYLPLEIYYALTVMPNGGEFEKIDISAYSIPQNVKEAYKASNGGYAFTLEFDGYQEGNVVVIGVDGNGCITKIKVIQNNEIMGANILDKLDGSVGIVAGCTVTSQACNKAIGDAIEAAAVLNRAYIK